MRTQQNIKSVFNTLPRFLTAALALATAFTLSSCSSDSDDGYDPGKCGGKKYDVDTQYCENDVIINKEKCGGFYYIPTSSFCYEGFYYPLCNGLVYDPETQNCDRSGDNEIVLDVCGGSGYDYSYNPATQFCYKSSHGYDEIVDKCGGEIYDYDTHFCYENEIVKLCMGYVISPYDPATQFCYYGYDNYYGYDMYRVAGKCGGEEYNLTMQFCYENEIIDRCGGETYIPATQFCAVNNTVQDKCGVAEFNPTTEFCDRYTVREKCGGEEYNLTMQFCAVNNTVQNKCYDAGNYVEFNPITEFCYGTTVTNKCGGEIYSGLQFCDGTTVVDRCGYETYNTVTEFCDEYSITVREKCGDETYNSSTQYCLNNIVTSKGELVDSRDGKSYKTVIIGTQVWMAENLNHEVDGSKCYDDDPANCAIYGRLYDWATAMDGSGCTNFYLCNPSTDIQGVCPSGWHLPTNDEWETLKNYIETDKSCTSCDAKHLKATSGWNNNHSNGTDDFGFAALPGGYSFVGNFYYVGNESMWWSATEIDASRAYSRSIIYDNPTATTRHITDRSFFVSVRCVKD